MYMKISYKFHRFPNTQSRNITKVHDFLGQINPGIYKMWSMWKNFDWLHNLQLYTFQLLLVIVMEFVFGMDPVDMKHSCQICDSIFCNRLSEIVRRHKFSHILLDDVQLYAACNFPIPDETTD